MERYRERMDERKELLKKEIVKKLSFSKQIDDQQVYAVLDEVITEAGRREYISLEDKQTLRKELFNSLRRFDILQELLDDDEITEIMINGPEHIFIEKKGCLYPWNRKFESKERLEDIIQQIVSKANRSVNEAHPIVDARLEDGSRIHVVLPPVAVNGPILTIRKFPSKPISMEDLIRYQSITGEAAEFLRKLVISRYNIFISGGTGSGKTTFLNVLSNYIPKEERVITIEDSAELNLNAIENLVSLEVRNANVEGKNEVQIGELIKAAFRMRPEGVKII
ncbi:CpaF family protein [Velocimicrobium porci]|nr:ATPase, T2SS/T4P/T4SS family [Velocimicrobium porci]